MNDDAKIIGITPAIANLSGICVFCPPYIFLPTTFLAYCTGTLLSASCTKTTAATNNTAPKTIAIAISIPVVLTPSVVTINLHNVTNPDGILEMIPTKIIIEIPFPIPLLVISSPNHISTDVPATNDITTTNPVKNPGLINIPDLL